jgi:iron complex outermembrane receptor protein
VPFFSAATPVFRYTRRGFYLQDLVDLDEHWSVLGGVRFDEVDLEAERALAFGLPLDPTLTPLPQINETFQAVSPRVGLVYQPIPCGLALYANYSQSFTPPTGEALLFAVDPLEKETGEAYEAGVKTYLLDNLMLHVAGFHITRENAPFLDVDANNPQAPPVFYQVGEERSQGVEVELIGQVTDRLSVLCNYAYVDTKLTDPINDDVFFGQRQRNVPYNTSSLWGRYNLIDDCCHTLGVGAGLLWVDDRTADREASLLLPSYTRFDGGLFYSRGCWDATLYLENVGDIDYATGSINTLRILPGAPFNVRGMVGVCF